MTFREELKKIEKRLKTIKNNKRKIKKIMTRKKLLPQDKLNRSDKNLISNFIHPTIINDRIKTLKSKRQTTIGNKNNVKRITNSKLEEQKQKLIQKYNELATIKENIGAKKSSRRKKKKRTRYKKQKRGGRGKSRRRRKQKRRRTKRR